MTREFEAEVAVSAQCQLGEGPVWDPDRGLLWWVDLLAGSVHAIDPSTGARTRFDAGDAVEVAFDGELVGKRADGEGVRDIVDRAVPANPHMICRGSILAAHIGNVVGHIDNALAQLAAAAVNDIGLECRLDRREDGAMQPRIGTAVLVERRFEMLRADRVIIVVLDVVFAGPRYFDGAADHARQHSGFGDIVRL